MRTKCLQVLLAVVLLAACSCSLPADRGIKLGVPHRQQERFNYCVLASVLMWRLYDGLPAVSQTTIYNWLGGAACTADQIPAAVSHFTNTWDSYADIVFSPIQADVEDVLARQITSIDSRSPVIAIVGSKNHVGVINGGQYHEEGNLKVWDFVYFHDPGQAYGDDYYSAADWLDFFCRDYHSHCAQVVSRAAITGWEYNLKTWGDSVQIYGDPQPFRPTPSL